MRKLWLYFILALGLGVLHHCRCGADGPPRPPLVEPAQPKVKPNNTKQGSTPQTSHPSKQQSKVQ